MCYIIFDDRKQEPLCIKKRKTEKTFRGVQVQYNENYYINPNTNEEVYFRSAEKENAKELVEAYKKQVGLLTSKEIKRNQKIQVNPARIFLCPWFGRDYCSSF